MSSKRCCVPRCAENGGSRKALHLFPNPEIEPERFRTWVHAVGGEILGHSNEYVYKQRRVCHAHFESQYCCRNDRISNIAVPTLHLSAPSEHTYCTKSNTCDHSYAKNLINTSHHSPQSVNIAKLEGNEIFIIGEKDCPLLFTSKEKPTLADFDDDNDHDDALPELSTENVSSTSIDNELSSEPETSRAIIARVYHYLQKEYECLKTLVGGSCDVSPFADILRRTATATGVTEKTVTSVLQESKCAEQHDDLDNNTSTQDSPLHSKTKEDTPKTDTALGDDVYILDLRENDAVNAENENKQCTLKKNSQLPSVLIKSNVVIQSASKGDGSNNDILSKLQRCRWCSVRKRGYNKNLWMCKQCKVSLCLNKCLRICCRVPWNN